MEEFIGTRRPLVFAKIKYENLLEELGYAPIRTFAERQKYSAMPAYQLYLLDDYRGVRVAWDQFVGDRFYTYANSDSLIVVRTGREAEVSARLDRELEI